MIARTLQLRFAVAERHQIVPIAVESTTGHIGNPRGNPQPPRQGGCYEDTSMHSGRAALALSAVGARTSTPIVGPLTAVVQHGPRALTCLAQPSQCDPLAAGCGVKGNGSMRVAEFASFWNAKPIGTRCHKPRIGGKRGRVHSRGFTASPAYAGFLAVGVGPRRSRQRLLRGGTRRSRADRARRRRRALGSAGRRACSVAGGGRRESACSRRRAG
jgi:hypothetical protein